MNNINNIKEKGFIDFEIKKNTNLVSEINNFKKEKNAIILAHYYQNSEIQDIADFVGDSLKLSQEAQKTNAKIILFAGVHFMAETAKILSPNSKVLLPDLNAGCSLSDSCNENEFAEFLKLYPDHIVVSYVNTTANIKAISDIICTSSNAKKIIDSIPIDKKIVFAPDRNLGNYLNSITGRNMVVWNGACHVHEEFSLERILELKKVNPNAKIISHPECEKPILLVSDFIGSTEALLNYSISDKANKYIVSTESGILHQMRKASPNKIFIPAPPKDSTCGCNECRYMKLHTLEKIYNCLKFELPEITIQEGVRLKAEKSILKMLELSTKFEL